MNETSSVQKQDINRLAARLDRIIHILEVAFEYPLALNGEKTPAIRRAEGEEKK